MLNGCAGSTPIKKHIEHIEHIEPTTTKSLIYIYRAAVFAASAQSPYVYVDGVEQKNKLVNGKCIALYVPAQKHTITIKGKGGFFGWGYPDTTITIDTQPQSKHYVRLSTSLTAIYGPNAMDFGLDFREVPEYQGNSEIHQCSLTQ